MDCLITKGVKGEACRVCGFVLPMDVTLPFHRKCPEPCPHFAERTGVLKVVCREGFEAMQVMHRCKLFGRCLPSWRPTPKQRAIYLERPDAIAKICDGCEARLSTIHKPT